MTQKEKARAYDEALEKAKKELQTCGSTDCDAARQIYRFFPELKESEDKRIRNVIRGWIYTRPTSFFDNGISKEEMLAWLEKQSEQKPFDYENATIIQKDFAPKEVTFTQEVETGNGNIKALVTEKLDSTNKSTEDDVRRRSTIWILEYARGLDTYNQYGKADIDKNIAWLEKQGIYKEWTNNDYDKIKSIEYLLHEFNNHNFDDWFNSLKRIEEQQ